MLGKFQGRFGRSIIDLRLVQRVAARDHKQKGLGNETCVYIWTWQEASNLLLGFICFGCLKFSTPSSWPLIFSRFDTFFGVGGWAGGWGCTFRISFWDIFRHSLWHILARIYSDLFSGTHSCINSGIICSIFADNLLTSILTFSLADSNSGIPAYIPAFLYRACILAFYPIYTCDIHSGTRFNLVQGRWCPLRSCPRG